MTLKKIVILIVAIDFAVLTGLALWKQGIVGLLQLATANWMGMTLTADLCISLTLLSIALYRDARRRGKSPWPFLLLTLCTGSLGPLVYLFLREEPKTPVPLAGLAI